ncbi:germination protein M [Virgibacillus natechei]|uniref:Germination protein M n=1 Tax=Virgibacillus natechei TaxID=1216297 RepID=A0ABS4ID05_9BACI|nr:GerMN domain-containing protein [Virgibacillus natechei]MBP1968824.1 germination protein M [Virgibacillus natechei]UZD11623.1 GerMN domain-containing protein [Virgibacillus natechei]
MLKRGILLTGALIFFIILTGCFQGEQSLEEMDPPQDAEAVDNLEEEVTTEDTEAVEDDESDVNEEETGGIADETNPRELYLLDSNGMVASQTLELPSPGSKEVATQVVEYLVKGGPVTSMLPNGFQAVLPEGTEVLGLNLQEDGTIVVDLSEEFENYEAENELNILESMTYTLTQFDNVQKMQLMINGHPQEEMPVNGTPIREGYSRANGINITGTDTLDLVSSNAVTIHYPTEHNENRYYVPVTQYVNSDNDEMFGSIVEEMIQGPGLNTNVTHVFNAQTELTDTPTLEDGVLELVFSEDVLTDTEQAMISDEVMETIVRTLTGQQSVDAVDVKVENMDQLVNENGETYDEPVTGQSFLPSEKL